MYPSPGKRVAVLAALIVAVVATDSKIGYAQGVGVQLTGEAVRARASAQRDIALKLFRRFLTLPNHSAHAEDIKRPVAWMEPQFAVRGFQTWRIETEGSTVLFAERSFPGAEKSSAVIDTVKSAQELLHTLDSKKKQLIAHGGTILLETGRYGVVDIRDIAPAKRIRIAAAEGATPEFVHIRVLNAEKITLDGLSVIAVRPSHERYAGRWRRHLLEVLGSKEVHLLNMYVASARDTSKWSKEDWLENVLNGVFIRGSSHTIVKDSLFENVFNGMTDYRGSDNLFEDNTVREFAGDGIRAIGQNGTFKGNHVTDCIKVNENHDDGIQSWAYGPKGRPGKGELVGLKTMMMEYSHGPMARKAARETGSLSA